MWRLRAGSPMTTFCGISARAPGGVVALRWHDAVAKARAELLAPCGGGLSTAILRLACDLRDAAESTRQKVPIATKPTPLSEGHVHAHVQMEPGGLDVDPGGVSRPSRDRGVAPHVCSVGRVPSVEEEGQGSL